MLGFDVSFLAGAVAGFAFAGAVLAIVFGVAFIAASNGDDKEVGADA